MRAGDDEKTSSAAAPGDSGMVVAKVGDTERMFELPRFMRSGGGVRTALDLGERVMAGEDFRELTDGDLLCIEPGVSRAVRSTLRLRSTEPGLSPASNFCHFAWRGGLKRPKSLRSSWRSISTSMRFARLGSWGFGFRLSSCSGTGDFRLREELSLLIDDDRASCGRLLGDRDVEALYASREVLPRPSTEGKAVSSVVIASGDSAMTAC